MQFAPFVTPVTLIVACMAGVMIIRFILKPLLFVSRQDMYLLLYLCIVTISFLWTLTDGNWGNFVFWWYVCVASYFSARSALRTAADFRMVAFAFFIGVLITAFNLELSFDDWGNTNMRYSVFGHNTNFTAYVLSGGLFLFLAMWIHIGPTRAMLFLLPIWIGLTFYCQILTGTRGALLSSALTVVFFLLRRSISNYGLKAIIILMFAISFGVSIGFFNLAISFADSLIGGRSTGDLSSRGLIWVQAYTYIGSHPFLGIGPGSFAEISELHAGAHNIFLTILLESGLVGVILLGGFFFQFLRGVLVKSPTRREGLILVALFSCFWLPIVSSGHWELAPFSWLLLALIGRLVSIESDGKSVRLVLYAPSR